jgi:8-oxo-dGTP diphosphatase
MAEFTWHPRPVPAAMAVRQVYGFLFMPDGRLLIRIDGAKNSLPGGRPEPGEDGYIEVLQREAMEEVTVEIDQTHYLGYQCVDEQDGTPPYAQVRMVARIAAVLPQRPDPDNGRIYRRYLVDPAKAADLLGWGELGHQQAAAAVQVAANLLDLPRHDLPTNSYI